VKLCMSTRDLALYASNALFAAVLSFAVTLGITHHTHQHHQTYYGSAILLGGAAAYFSLWIVAHISRRTRP